MQKPRAGALVAFPPKATPSSNPPTVKQPAVISSDMFVSVKEAAVILHCSKSFLDKLRVSGGGPEFVRLGARKVLYRCQDLETWARSRRFESTSQYPNSK